MKLSTLSVDGFRGLRDLRLSIAGRVAALVGVNGSGKTSILEACSVLLGVLIQRLTSAQNPRPVGFDDETGRLRSPRGSVHVEGEFFLGSSSGRISVSRKAGIDDVHVSPSIETWMTLAISGSWRLPLLAHYRTGRLWVEGDVAYAGSLDWSTGYHGALDPLANEYRWGSWLPPERRAQGIALVRRLVGMLRPDVHLRGEIGLSQDGHISLVSNNGHLPLRLLPDGVRNIITILVDMTCRALALNPGLQAHEILKTDGIVLIDEIDLHLHPALQRSAVNVLLAAFPNIQFIITTHSPFVLKELPSGAIVNLDGLSAGSEGSIEDIAEEVLGVSVPQRSVRQRRLVSAATAYFAAMHTANAHELAELRANLDEAMAPFGDDSAVVALLKLEELAARGGNR